MKTEICGITAEYVVKNVKNIRITIKSNGEVVLTTPKHVKREYAERFFMSKIEFITKHKREIDRQLNEKDLLLKNSQMFFWGKKISVKRVECDDDSVKRNENEIVVYYKKQTETNRLIENFLKKELNGYLNGYFSKWQQITGLYAKKISVTKTISKWGSCTTNTGKIRMSLYLVNLPVFCTEYVVLHELLHLKYPNHGENFHKALFYYMPAWKNIRRFMRNEGLTMRFLPLDNK